MVKITPRMQLLTEFKKMYEKKQFEPYLFDLNSGYLQTVFSDQDKMPLNFFVEYNNQWWFPIPKEIIVPSISYDDETQSGAIFLDIYYNDKDILRAVQYVKFKSNKIHYIRTYTSPDFFLRNDMRIQLDKYGNDLWLKTGYDLDYSEQVALHFFDSPKGKSFAKHEITRPIVRAIKKNINDYLNRKLRDQT